MRRIALLALALVLTLGALGVGYAMWFDDVVIRGDVETGSVDIEIYGLSETYVYKNLTSSEIVYSGRPLEAEELLPVASATTTDVSTGEDFEAVVMEFKNIFPTDEPIVADVWFHYNGSVPAHVFIEEEFRGEDADVIAGLLIQRWFIWDPIDARWIPVDFESLQLHYCNYYKLEVFLDPAALQKLGADGQGLSGQFQKTIHVHQWNEDWPA